MSLVRADSGFRTHGMIAELEARGLKYILTAALRAPVRTLCRHDDSAWTPTEVPGIEVQDLTHHGVRLHVTGRPMGSVRPDREEHRAFEQEFFRVGRATEAVKQCRSSGD